MPGFRPLVLFLTAGILLPCFAGAQEPPKDILKKYPADQFIHRLGTGETPEQASESARFEIASFFEAKISGETYVRQWAESATSHGKTLEKNLTEMSNTVIIGANRDIPGIEIAASIRNDKRNVYEAWAVLDKANYRSVLRDRITSIDRDVSDRLTRPQTTEIGALQNLSSVTRSLILRKRSRQDLLLLDPNDPVESRDQTLAAVMTSLDSLITGAFDVALICDSTMKSPIRAGLVKGIVEAGIRLKEYPDDVSAKSAGADMFLMAEQVLSPRSSSFRDRTYYNLDWVLTVKAADPTTGSVIDAIVLNDKTAGAASDAQAEDRMVQRVLSDHVPKISTWVYNVIFKPEP